MLGSIVVESHENVTHRSFQQHLRASWIVRCFPVEQRIGLRRHNFSGWF
ncbi:Uncharacterised protein [Segatella copri]|nr:Uncharacterised protein [Segatella copri]